MAHYSQFSLNTLFDLNGKPLAGAYIRFFDADGNTPRAAYSDGALTTLYDPNNIRASASGRLPKIWLQSAGAYKARITSAAGALVEEIDDVPIDEASGGGGGGGGGGTTLPSGFGGWIYGTAAPDGWVRANGRTIGSALSLATERANADCESLFLWLWNTGTTIAVEGGRGATAAADWAANKKLTLPDARGRAIVGLDDMGNSAAGRLTGGTFSSGSATQLGSVGGTATHTLVTGEIAAHTHTGSASTEGLHSHTGTTGGGGSHAHGGTTGGGGSHTHGITLPVLTGTTIVDVAPGALVPLAGSGFYFADTVGDHSHGFTTDAVGNHSHDFGTSSNGLHSHTISINPAGGGGAHNNMQPFVLVTHLLKL